MRGKRPAFMHHVRAAYRSGLEVAVCAALNAAGVAFQYETVKVPFIQPAKSRTYTPDVILPNGIVVELKGLWTVEDRQKHQMVKAQHPDLDIRLVFSNPNAKLSKGSPTTYAAFCEKTGFRYAKKDIPESWVTEPLNALSANALRALGWRPSG